MLPPAVRVRGFFFCARRPSVPVRRTRRSSSQSCTATGRCECCRGGKCVDVMFRPHDPIYLVRTMPRPLYAALACAAVLADISTSVRAQTLAEVARKEEDRRKAIGNPSKVYTNADLKPVPKSAAPPPAASEKKDGDGKNDDKKDEKKDAADKDKDAAPKDAAKDA